MSKTPLTWRRRLGEALTLRRVLGALALLASSSCLSASLQPRGEGGRPLTSPVLGLEIEEFDDRYLFQDLEGGWVEGTLEQCEEARLMALKAQHGSGRFNLPFPTLGGEQFWADELVFCGWRIQQNVFSEHFRLLDPDDDRQAWGSFEGCRVALEEARMAGSFAPRSERAVVLLHGLIRSRASLSALEEAFEEAGYDVVSVGYPSTQRTLEEHADQLERVLNRLEGTRQVSFVTHSLGGLVARTALARPGDAPDHWRQRIAQGRLVMIFPPSQGAALAEWWSGCPAYGWVMGAAGEEIRPKNAAALPQPTCPFLVIAGGRGDDEGRNARIPGDDDGTVGVSEARLPGGAFRLFDVGHTFGMRDPQVISAALNFVNEG